jgi:hypothetical protein
MTPREYAISVVNTVFEKRPKQRGLLGSWLVG